MITNREAQQPVELDELYRDLILDHYRNPRNKGELDIAEAVAEGLNPACGDEIRVSIQTQDGKVVAVRFTGRGCSISQASASMMMEEVEERPIDEIRALSGQVQAMLTQAGFDLDSVDLGDLEALHGVAKFPVRIKCALLAWKVLEQALADAGGGTVAPDSEIQTRVAGH